eukprot:1161470-Pelagomonas_calceolata.AAC.2
MCKAWTETELQAECYQLCQTVLSGTRASHTSDALTSCLPVPSHPNLEKAQSSCFTAFSHQHDHF